MVRGYCYTWLYVLYIYGAMLKKAEKTVTTFHYSIYLLTSIFTTLIPIMFVDAFFLF